MMKKVNSQHKKLHVKVGDKVQVISGDSKGKSGNILKILKEKNRAIVEGINKVTKHVKPSATSPQGGIEEKEAPVHISNLMVVDPKSGKPTRIGRKAGDDGKLERYSKKTGEIIK